VKYGLNVARRGVLRASEVPRTFNANLVLMVNQLLVLVAGVKISFVVLGIRTAVPVFAVGDDAVLVLKARRFRKR
jgi:hypothetical protein